MGALPCPARREHLDLSVDAPPAAPSAPAVAGASSRRQPFSFVFHPNGKDEEDGPYRSRVIPPTGVPVEVESPSFVGRILLLHDTGNEPHPRPADNKPRKGLELRLQGRFKRATTTGELTSTGLWIGGVLEDTLKLGWFRRNIIRLLMQFARSKCEGRLHFSMGGGKDKNGNVEKPNLAFPVGQLFTIVGTPPGEAVPPIESPEWDAVEWQMSAPAIDTETTYTLLLKTPYLDAFSWELLKVPGVSPLPLESVLGDTRTARIFLYDLGVAGSHKDWKKGMLVELHFARGEAPLEDTEHANAPLDGASEPPDEKGEALEEDGLQEGDVPPSDASGS